MCVIFAAHISPSPNIPMQGCLSYLIWQTSAILGTIECRVHKTLGYQDPGSRFEEGSLAYIYVLGLKDNSESVWAAQSFQEPQPTCIMVIV